MLVTWGRLHSGKAPRLQTANTWAVWTPRGGLDGRGWDVGGAALALHWSSVATTTLAFFDVKNDILSILYKVLFKPKFHSPQHSPSSQLPPLSIPRGKFWKTTAQNPRKSTLLMRWNRLRLLIVHFAPVSVLLLEEDCKYIIRGFSEHTFHCHRLENCGQVACYGKLNLS